MLMILKMNKIHIHLKHCKFINRILSREPKSFVSCSHMNCCLQKIYNTSINIFYLLLLFISREIWISKNYQNPTSTSKDTYKTIFIILFKLFSIGNSFEFKATQEIRLI